MACSFEPANAFYLPVEALQIKRRFTLILVLLLFTSVQIATQTSAKQTVPRDPRYPAHWWAPVSETGKPDWEILPQEAGPGEVILSKRHELGLLSNFAATPFTFRGKRYASLEGFWQMMLYPEGPHDPRAKFADIQWKYSREQVAQMTAFEAKSAGTLAEQNMSRMGIDWVTFEGKRFKYRSAKPGEHYRLIFEATRKKVAQNPEVKNVLLTTGDLILKPDHHGEPNAPPEWRYYEILMIIRSELQDEKPEEVTLCQLTGDPAKYNQKLIKITGFLSHGFEDSGIFDPRLQAEWFTSGHQRLKRRLTWS